MAPWMHWRWLRRWPVLPYDKALMPFDHCRVKVAVPAKTTKLKGAQHE